MAISLTPEVTALLRRLEEGVKSDGRFKYVWTPSLTVDLDGITAVITVQTGRMRRSLPIKESAETAEEAVNKLLESLDYWYKVLTDPRA